MQIKKMINPEEFGELQRLVDGMFAGGRTSIERLDIVVQAE